MKLLILTQAVDKNDPVLGFFHRWLEEFAKRCEQVTVICLKKGEHDLPNNVKVLSLGKEEGKSVLKYLFRFYIYIWRERKNYDSVFVHMNQEYVILGWKFWWLWGKKISLWYVHRQTSFSLWLAEKFAHIVFTSTPESFRIASKKMRYVGHGISFGERCSGGFSAEAPIFTHIGRITPIKRCEILIEALALLKKDVSGAKLVFVGEPVSEDDRRYEGRLHTLIEKLDVRENVEFAGSVPHETLHDWLCRSCATINFAPTGGMDKAVLESFAVGVPVFFANDAFKRVAGERAEDFHIVPQTSEMLAEKMRFLLSHPEKRDIHEISEQVRSHYSVPAIISRILENL